MPKWLLPTVSEVVALSDPAWMQDGSGKLSPPHSVNAKRYPRADREWTGAIAALNKLLRSHHCSTTTPTIAPTGEIAPGGVVLSGPSPVLSQFDGDGALSTWTLAAPSIHAPHWLGFQLLPAEKSPVTGELTHRVLPLLPGDPLATEQFCLALTPGFSLVMVLGEAPTGKPAFMFSFEPQVVQQAWEAVRPRILLMSSHQIDFLDDLVQQFSPVAPDFKTVMQFSRLMLASLPDSIDETRLENEGSDVAATRTSQVTTSGTVSRSKGADATDWTTEYPSATVPLPSEVSNFDVELVQAIAHEIRTPLTTIRTLTRSLLKRTDLAADVLRRLRIIDRECSEQIDRFGLIFKAVELETSNAKHSPMSLIRTSLLEVLQQSIPRWQQQASQRQMTLDVVLPQGMPTVVSDPTVLDQALTSLIERFTRSLPANSHIQVEVTLAGNQLKLQLQSQPDASSDPGKENPFRMLPKSLGQLLMFQPETGSLSLNLTVTKNLFQAIGGKLIVKQRPQQGEVMTVYLPLEVGSISPLDSNKIITV